MVVDGRYPSTGGAEMQAQLLSRSLKAAGHVVIVLAPQLDTRLPQIDSVDGIRVERLIYPHLKLVGAVILYLRFARLLWRRRNEYDAVHVHTAHFLAAAAALVRPLTRASLTIKVSGAWEFDGGVLDPRLRNRPLHRLANWLLRRADHIHCISEFTRARLLEAGYVDAQIRMIPNAVDLLRFVPSDARDNPPTVVFVGRLVPVKGLLVLLNAWPQVVAKVAARLVIVGDGPQRDELEAQMTALGIGSSVSFMGNMSDVPAALAGASIYVQPSHQEGMPNSVLEAMACGLPIVATAVSGNTDLVADSVSGLLVPPADARALASALASLLLDPDRARRMGQTSRRIVEERYALPAVLHRLLAAYRETRSA